MYIVYQCYFYVFVGLHSYYRRTTKCGPIHTCYDLALTYLETFKEKEKNFCAGFIYEFVLDSSSYGKLLYTTDLSIDEPNIFSGIQVVSKQNSYPQR